MVSVMSAETNDLINKRMQEAVREAQPATKADIDRLFVEVCRLQDCVGILLRGGSREGWGGTVVGDGGSGGATNEGMG